jgi:ubiquitin C-terminal hydrolase
MGVISIPIPDQGETLDDCLMEFIKDEILEGSEKYSCDKCKTKTDAIKNISLLKKPSETLLSQYQARLRYYSRERMAHQHVQAYRDLVS